MGPIIHQLKNSRSVLLATHTNPDGDAIGSLTAMGLALATLGKNILLYNESPIPAVYRFLPSVDQVANHIGNIEQYDTAVILDCGDLQRVGEAADAIGRIPSAINIDHHITNTGFGTLQLVDITACATAEIVYRIIKGLEVGFDKHMAVFLKQCFPQL